ncbi:unnamed protein product (macronuclear) [Paramecium tetraurelia]|uniref:non-specific serine/threonine protein kinase n=1 Tax=Paramecium tetraurelia TaxID=5888 RepID=A0DQD1_PARTE|nr:uncharacterized protein GSPATT00002648001 [Paramecium tetraurelia]CAK85248.1 unnamed protein product [Paramecium tetraurelia]|eukprot:XP_001452645.1 hypothetical protein (macronuclear) [Paramecium tetraurelia strain d4-2]
MIRPLSEYESCYKDIKIIGRGQFGIVYLVQQKSTQKEFAAKKIKGECSNTELDILFRLKHPNIINVYDCFRDENQIILIMDYCQKGDLWNMIQYRILEGKNRGYIQKVVEQWLVQLLMGLAYIHDNNVIHRDLKSSNILIKEDGQLKIADFGVAKILGGEKMAKTIAGSPFYLSPEISQGQDYTFSSDLWSLGCILFEMCTLKRAFEGDQFDKEILIQDQIEPTLTDIRTYSSELVNLIQSLLDVDAQKRPSAKELLRSSYIAKIMLQSFEKKSVKQQDMQKIGQVTMMQKKAHEKYQKQMSYVKQLLGNSQDSINAQSQVL